MPLELNEERHVASAGESSADAQNTAALAGRWGNFMPIDQWTPPRITAQFKGLEFRSLGYNMSPGNSGSKTPDSCFGDSTPDTYERCFAGVQESIQELAAMLQHSQGKAWPPISGWSSATESVNEGKAVDDQVDDGPSYNLGWNTLPLTSQSNQSTVVDHSTGSDDDAPAYDLGWGATVTSGQEGGVVLRDDDAPAYDLGWGVTTAAEQPMQEDVTTVSGDADDGPVYDLRWGVNSPGEEPMEEDNDGPSYDLGWGSAPSGEQLIPQDVIDPTDKEPSYDLGWGEVRVTSRCPSPLSPLPDSSAPMDLDRDIRDTSPVHYGSETKDAILRENWRLKAIGNDMTDQHIHAIIENAVHGLDYSRALGQILMENRHVLRGFAEAQNRVTSVGSDMCKLHRLIQLQRRLLKSVDHVIGSLENPER
ncbi:hypothetical protein DFH29DRAFT_1006936 [Suillus ampliporus]|nr:hypothetical protein DFH29DRAFT_1006936 [Suillus ampliporus]